MQKIVITDQGADGVRPVPLQGAGAGGGHRLATGGVDAVSLAGDSRDQVVVVVGDGIDSVKLASALRRKVGPAEIVQVAQAKEEGGGNNTPAAALPEFVASGPWYYQHYPQPAAAVVHEHPAYGYQTRTDSVCSIM